MEKGLYFLSCAYHGTEEQKAYRTELFLKAAAVFLRQGIHLFSPVIYVNKIVEKLNLPSLEERRDMVMPYLFYFLRVSKGLILITTDGWQHSWGVQLELKFCQENRIPVYTINPYQLSENLTQILSSPLDEQQVAKLLEAA
jgi:hypothetical protein